MTKLRFHASEDALQPVPDFQPVAGQPAQYIGRAFDPATRGYPATREPFEIDASAPVAERLKLICSRGDLFPADAETAAACGVSMPNLQFNDGVWSVKPAAVAAEKAKQRTEEPARGKAD